MGVRLSMDSRTDRRRASKALKKLARASGGDSAQIPRVLRKHDLRLSALNALRRRSGDFGGMTDSQGTPNRILRADVQLVRNQVTGKTHPDNLN